jgi:hypothetical protein
MITYRNRHVPETFEEIVDPNHTVLLVHEMRNDLREHGTPDKNGQMVRIEFDPIVRPTCSTQLTWAFSSSRPRTASARPRESGMTTR